MTSEAAVNNEQILTRAPYNLFIEPGLPSAET